MRACSYKKPSTVHHNLESVVVLPLHYWCSTRPSGPSIVIVVLQFVLFSCSHFICHFIAVAHALKQENDSQGHLYTSIKMLPSQRILEIQCLFSLFHLFSTKNEEWHSIAIQTSPARYYIYRVDHTLHIYLPP